MFCETFSSTISCEVCIKRQKMAKKIGKNNLLLKGKDSLLHCLECEHGNVLLNDDVCYLDRDITIMKKQYDSSYFPPIKQKSKRIKLNIVE